MSSLKLLIGADPEAFFQDKDGKFVSAHDVLPGTKLEPYKVENGAIQVDGTAAEFNTDPASTAGEFVRNIRSVMTTLRARSPGLTLVIEPTCTFDDEYFKSLPEETRELGCNPDFNAYTGQVNPAPDGDTTMRTASGHIHLGWCEGVNPSDPIHFDDCLEVVKQLDYYLGLYSLLWDPDDKRRQLYGKAGAFRPKPYGVEYRTMSNVWLRSERVQEWIFNTAKIAIDSLSGGQSMTGKFGEFARKAIDGNDVRWYESSEGRKIHGYMGLSWPDYKSCLSVKKEDTKDKIVLEPKKKSRSSHSYAPGVGLLDIESSSL